MSFSFLVTIGIQEAGGLLVHPCFPRAARTVPRHLSPHKKAPDKFWERGQKLLGQLYWNCTRREKSGGVSSSTDFWVKTPHRMQVSRSQLNFLLQTY